MRLCYFCRKEGDGERDGPFQCHFQWQSTNAGPLTAQEAVKRSGVLACSSKYSRLVRGASKGQYTVTSQKLDSWVFPSRCRGGGEGDSPACLVAFITFACVI